MHKNSAVEWNRGLRKAAAVGLIGGELIGGPGYTVEVDENIFCKRKYTEQWVLSGLCRETGECFPVPEDGLSSRALMPLTRCYV
ncbi:hypothetical protein M514_11583 [Trichuris suis]|uniref:ISXO2-like transposase domain-containing protein n=1 Tax=Trichuris suis TaxID=68888 RepID=A0A085LRE3_9BILA|nr:hypothetical protein M513_11583 [Trichuris suis]KFD60534.1 hypothetical protein M514_11583 [Trichuris suis]